MGFDERPNTPRSILVVEDDEDLREALAELLRFRGFRVLEAANGRRAVELLENEISEPCTILLDLMMPVMNGWAVLDHLERQGIHRSSPIFVITAAGDVPLKPRYSLFKKPVRPIELLRMLELSSP